MEVKSFRIVYVQIRPAMEAALKSLWLVGKRNRKAVPQSLETLVEQVEEAFPDFHGIFSAQMGQKDSRGNTVYRKVNGWAHADPQMWSLYKNGEEIEYVLTALRNMIAFAQTELLRYDPFLVREGRCWSRQYE
jgi:hypothetical protein